jgi:hypothetical protein
MSRQILCGTAAWVKFLCDVGYQVRESGRFEIGPMAFRDFSISSCQITVRVRRTAETWTKDELSRVVNLQRQHNAELLRAFIERNKREPLPV